MPVFLFLITVAFSNYLFDWYIPNCYYLFLNCLVVFMFVGNLCMSATKLWPQAIALAIFLGGLYADTFGHCVFDF